MMKPGALLLLLAVAASQVDLYYTLTTLYEGSDGDADISSCPITFYGRTYNMVEVLVHAGSSVSFCFKNNQSETTQDCALLGHVGDVARVRLTEIFNPTAPGSSLHNALPNIKSTGTCYTSFSLISSASKTIGTGVLYNFGRQSAANFRLIAFYAPDNSTFDLTVGNNSMGSWFLTKEEASNRNYFDTSGCRVSGVPYAAGSDIGPGAEPCTKVICDASANVTTVSTCGPTEVCQDNVCVPTVVCTVTGSTVIDFHGRVHSVPDRCAIRLMSHPGNSEFELVAGFRERRRTDVSFLDYLIIKLNDSDVEMRLEQGGRVRVGDHILPLSAMPRLFYGVELSKDQTGVTAKIPFTNMTLFFDGNTAHVSGPVEPVKGLCGYLKYSNFTTTLNREAAFTHSDSDCIIRYNDTFDSMIDCNHSTEFCNLMRQAPFTACHNYTDPEPYITACTNTMCNYPPVDFVDCQFLEAYAKACSLKSGVTLEDWRTTAACPADAQDFCRDQYCSDHEFCGGTRCRCRALFASKYKPMNALGEPTVCVQNSATLTLAGCLLEDKGIDYSKLHLNDPYCRGEMNPETHMVTFSYDNGDLCGTEVMSNNNSQLIFKNTIRTVNSSGDIITRQDQVEIDFSCFYTKPDIRSVSFTVKDSSVVQRIVSGVWNYTLMMNAYTDIRRTHLIRPGTKLTLNQRILLVLKTEGVDEETVALVTDSCWATSQPSPDGNPRYNLIINGCPNPADKTVIIEANGRETTNVLIFNMFQFSGHTGEIYLHCQVELCPKRSQSCAPSCGAISRRKRRSYGPEYADGKPGLITMAWSN